MFKSLKILIYSLFLLYSSLAISQSIDGLQEIVKIQQDKISLIENNLKTLIGSIEEQSNLNQSNANSKLIENPAVAASCLSSLTDNRCCQPQ